MIGLALLGVVAAFVFIWLLIAPIASSYLSKTLGMKVSVGSVTIRPRVVKISNFKIDNPWKYKATRAFEADSITSFYEWNRLKDNPSIIDRIEIDQIYLGIEFANPLGTKNNWSDLLSNMPERSDAKEVIVHKLVMKNMTVKITGMGIMAKTQTKTFDRMEFSNVSSKHGFPVDELIVKIFGNAGLMQYIQDVIPDPGKMIKQLLPKKIFPFSQNEKGQEFLPSPSNKD